MRNDTNYISPNFNAYDMLLEPLPELTSDDKYIQARKQQERKLYEDLAYLRDEAITDNLSDRFVSELAQYLNAKVPTVEDAANAFLILAEDVKKHIEEQARIDVDNMGDDL